MVKQVKKKQSGARKKESIVKEKLVALKQKPNAIKKSQASTKKPQTAAVTSARARAVKTPQPQRVSGSKLEAVKSAKSVKNAKAPVGKVSIKAESKVAKKVAGKVARKAPAKVEVKLNNPTFRKKGRYPKSISRIETTKHSAWYVRIYFEEAYARKTFSDSVYGGKRNAFREALQWRDDMEKRMGKPRTDRSVRKKVIAGNKDVGIYRRHRREMKRGITYFRDVYEVAISAAPGKIWRTTVSINKHGEEKALRMARMIRREKEREYFGGTIY